MAAAELEVAVGLGAAPVAVVVAVIVAVMVEDFLVVLTADLEWVVVVAVDQMAQHWAAH